MKNPTTAEQAAAYVNNESKHMTATCNGNEVILNTDLGEFTLSLEDRLYLAKKWRNKHAWYANMPLEHLAARCHEELDEFYRTQDRVHLDNIDEGLKYLTEKLQQKALNEGLDKFANDKI